MPAAVPCLNLKAQISHNLSQVVSILLKLFFLVLILHPMSYTLRLIEESDNPALAEVIKTALEEQGNNKPGTIYCDPQLYQMHGSYQTPDSAYFVAVENGELSGGCGIAR